MHPAIAAIKNNLNRFIIILLFLSRDCSLFGMRATCASHIRKARVLRGTVFSIVAKDGEQCNVLPISNDAARTRSTV